MSRISKTPVIRRHELIDSAEELFSSQGYDKTSVSDIVKNVKVAQGTFYYYFKTKEDILRAVIERNVTLLKLTALEKIAKMEPDPMRQLQQIINILLGFKELKSGFYHYLHLEKSALLHKNFNEQLFRVFVPLLTGMIDQGVRSKTFEVNAVAETAEILLVIIEHLNDTAHLQDSAAEHDRRKIAAEDFYGKLLGIHTGKFQLEF